MVGNSRTVTNGGYGWDWQGIMAGYGTELREWQVLVGMVPMGTGVAWSWRVTETVGVGTGNNGGMIGRAGKGGEPRMVGMVEMVGMASWWAWWEMGTVRTNVAWKCWVMVGMGSGAW